MTWFKSQYTLHLEQENAWLRKQLEDAHKALSPRLEQVQVRAEKPAIAANDSVERFRLHQQPHADHQISQFGSGGYGAKHWASCLCGWKMEPTTPEEVQAEITKHYRSYQPAIPRKGQLSTAVQVRAAMARAEAE